MEEDITPLPHDDLGCDPEDFDFDMHLLICEVLYNQCDERG